MSNCSYRACFHLSLSIFPLPLPHGGPPGPGPCPLPGPRPLPIPPCRQSRSCPSVQLHASHITVNAPTIATFNITYLRSRFRVATREIVCDGNSGECDDWVLVVERIDDIEGVRGHFSGARRSTIPVPSVPSVYNENKLCGKSGLLAAWAVLSGI